MAERILNGLQKIELGDVQGDGTEMPAVMTEGFRTYRDSVTLSEDDPDIQEEFADQSDDPFIVLSTKGAKTIKGSTFDYSPETLKKLKGGTIVDSKWKEPDVMPIIYQAVRLTTKTGATVECPKVQVFAKFNAEFKQKGVSLLEFTLKPLAPLTI